jgi:hypothetical protein
MWALTFDAKIIKIMQSFKIFSQTVEMIVIIIEPSRNIHDLRVRVPCARAGPS